MNTIKKTVCLLLCAAALCFGLTACGGGTESFAYSPEGFNITVVNGTGIALSELYVTPEADDSWNASNPLGESFLADGDSVDLVLDYTEEELEGSFSISAVDNGGESLGAVGGVYLQDGNTVRLVLTDGTLDYEIESY